MKYILQYAFSLLVILILLVVAGLGMVNWVGIPTGSLVDWVIGIAIFGWLMAITTVPWNIHFQAREVIAEVTLSLEKGITIAPEQHRYTTWKVIAQILSNRDNRAKAA